MHFIHLSCPMILNAFFINALDRRTQKKQLLGEA